MLHSLGIALILMLMLIICYHLIRSGFWILKAAAFGVFESIRDEINGMIKKKGNR